MSGYKNTHGKADGDAVLDYIMVAMREMPERTARRGHKFMLDLQRYHNRLPLIPMDVQNIMHNPMKAYFQERARSLRYDDGLTSRLLNLVKRRTKPYDRHTSDPLVDGLMARVNIDVDKDFAKRTGFKFTY